MNNEYPLIRDDAKAAEILTKLLAILTPALEVNTIQNVQFVNAKYYLNNLTDRLFFIHGLYYRHDLWFTTANQANNRIKLAEKLQKKNEQDAVTGFCSLTIFIAAAKELKSISDDLQSLKTKIVKRQMRSEEERAADYVPAIPTTKAAKQVNAILKEMTDTLTVEYEGILFDYFVRIVEQRMANPKSRGDRYTPNYADILLQSIGDKWESHTGNYTSLKADWKSILAVKAKQDAIYAQSMFLYKNVMKLATVVEPKGTMTHQINYGRVTGDGFQGEIVFSFADGSSFVVRNKVVVKYSNRGKGFRQFPTTFHAAILPNGTKMPGQPSEQEMKEQFATA